jgi:hypothetical protein
MTRKRNNVSPRIAKRLAEVAQEMRELMYGAEGYPEWGTRFHEIEEHGMSIGQELSRLFMEQSAQQQAEAPIPEEALESDGERASLGEATHDMVLETPAGQIIWEQPKARLKQSRRDFFPSGPSAGPGCR